MNCPICGGGMQMLLDLPRFPITERYEPASTPFVEGRGFHDQAFHFCETCSHGRLEHIVPDLYGTGYLTKTAKSAGAWKAVENFIWFVHEHCGTGFNTLIDIGGNDGTLLTHYPKAVGRRSYERFCIDPNASGDCINVREAIETADLSQWKRDRKIIFSSHTIEHLEHPEVMIEKCAAVMEEGDYLALQFPSLELMVEEARIDWIHHQHVSYFSRHSISAMLAAKGLRIMSWRYDHSHWGALMLVTEKGNAVHAERLIDAQDVKNAITTWTTRDCQIPQGSIALGAALMLPVLAYWFPELDAVEYIADDDPSKEGLRYVNFDKPIKVEYDLEDRDVVITATGSKTAYRALTRKAIAAKARRIILPIPVL